jgi:hypothetical protein
MVLFLTRHELPQKDLSKFYARHGRPAFVDTGQCLSDCSRESRRLGAVGGRQDFDAAPAGRRPGASKPQRHPQARLSIVEHQARAMQLGDGRHE